MQVDDAASGSGLRARTSGAASAVGEDGAVFAAGADAHGDERGAPSDALRV